MTSELTTGNIWSLLAHFLARCKNIILPSLILIHRVVVPFLYGYSSELDSIVSSEIVQTMQLGHYFQVPSDQDDQLQDLQLEQLTSSDPIPIDIPDNWCIEPQSEPENTLLEDPQLKLVSIELIHHTILCRVFPSVNKGPWS